MEQGAEGLAGELDLASRGVAAFLADGLIVMAPGGEVTWLNEAFASLLGYEVTDLMGTNGYRLVHPDEVERATDGFAYSAGVASYRVVSTYRLAHRDGSWVHVEIKSGSVPHPDGDRLAIVVRDGRARRAVVRALRSVAQGGPFRSTAELTCQAALARWRSAGVVIVTIAEGEAETCASGLGHQLIDASVAIAGRPHDEIAVVSANTMDSCVADAARAQGFEGCAVAPVASPPGTTCALVVWFDRLVVARIEFRHVVAELAEVLTLSLERRDHLRQLQHVARHDSLTGLLNRVGFLEELDRLVGSTRADARTEVGILFIDLDELKQVNDLMGHAEGDQLLVRTGKRVVQSVPADALVGRIGGDEFIVAVPLPSASAATALVECADSVLAAMAIPATISVSIGLSLDDPAGPVSSGIARADAAMYRAKAAGPGTWSR